MDGKLASDFKTNIVLSCCSVLPTQTERVHQIQSYNLFKLPLILIYLKRLRRLHGLCQSFSFSYPDLRFFTSARDNNTHVAFMRHFLPFQFPFSTLATTQEKSSLISVRPYLDRRQLLITSLQ